MKYFCIQVENRGALDYEFYAHWHFDNILKRVGARSETLLFPDWQPTISDEAVAALGIKDLSSIGGNVTAAGRWLRPLPRRILAVAVSLRAQRVMMRMRVTMSTR